MISYAQNFEDVMLWRALGHVQNGFYIDIGAQDPVIDSVSLAFYEQGWRGVHVEPTPAYAAALRDARPDETIVQAAIGDHEGLIPFYEIPSTGISTGDADIARRHETSGFEHRRIEVPCIRLSALLDLYRDRDIHWMKIDVEGMELSVLRSWTPSSVRPWIVVAESTLPLTQTTSHETWEKVIVDFGYRFAYFDGLNRFYVCDQHPELMDAFGAPPNVFDNMVLSGLSSNSLCTWLNSSIKEAKARIDELELRRLELEDSLKAAQLGDAERARLAALERQVQQHTGEAERYAQDMLEQTRQVAQVLRQLDQARQETLELLRQSADDGNGYAEQSAAKDLTHAAELATKELVHSKELAARELTHSKELNATQLAHTQELTAKELTHAKELAANDLSHASVLASREQAYSSQLASKEAAHTAELTAREQAVVAKLAAKEEEQAQQLVAQRDAHESALRPARQDASDLREVIAQRERAIADVGIRLATSQADLAAARANAELLEAELERQHQDWQLRTAEQERVFAIALDAARDDAERIRASFDAQSERLAAVAASDALHAVAEDALKHQTFALQQESQRIAEENASRQQALVEEIESEKVAVAQWSARAAEQAAVLEKLRAHRLVRLIGRLGGRELSALLDANPDYKPEPPHKQVDALVPCAPPVCVPDSDGSKPTMAPRRQEPSVPTFSNGDAMQASTLSIHSTSAAQSVVELLQYEGIRFVQCAYLTLLRRPADPDGLAFFTQSLERGVPKPEVLRQLRESREGRSCNVQLRGLKGTVRRARMARAVRRLGALVTDPLRVRPLDPTPALDHLLRIHNSEFINGVYSALLNRSPDVEGYNFYLNRLQRGTPKWQLLAEVAGSPEATGRKLPGLEELVRRHRRATLPFAGRLLRRHSAFEGSSAIETRLRVIEQRVFAQGQAGSTRQADAPVPADRLVAPSSIAASAATDLTRFRLADDYSIDEPSWLAFLEKVIDARLLEPLRRAGTPPPAATLWLWVYAESADTSDAWALTVASLDHLQRASEYPIRFGILSPRKSASSKAEAPKWAGSSGLPVVSSMVELSAFVADADQILFLRPGDEVRPELHMALKYFGSFERHVTFIDLYFRDEARIYPVLLHGYDPVHARAVDCCHSRFGIRAGLVRELTSKGVCETPRELMVAYLDEHGASDAHGTHIALPLLSVSLRRSDLQRMKVHEIHNMVAASDPTPVDGAPKSALRHSSSVSAVICTKDGTHLLHQLVWRLLREPAIAEIVIVSNNSSNAFSIALLDTLVKVDRVVVVRYDKPFNFSAQCNLGAKYATGEHLFFVNDDIAPVSDDWLETMLDALEPTPGQDAIVGPMLLYPDQSVQHAGMFLGFNNVAGHSFRHARLPDRSTSMMLVAPRRLSCLTGAALLMKRSVFAALNGFDPMLATYLQDVDLSLRATNSGIALVFEPRAILFHMESVSIKPELTGTYMGSVRHNEYVYFSRRWGDLIAAGDEWASPLLDPSDESMRTLRV